VTSPAEEHETPHRKVRRFVFFGAAAAQAALMALTGQVSMQAPQSMQVSGSILCLSPAGAMELTGQLSTQAPQLVQSSLIT
jgi:hypothetical protein